MAGMGGFGNDDGCIGPLLLALLHFVLAYFYLLALWQVIEGGAAWYVWAYVAVCTLKLVLVGINRLAEWDSHRPLHRW
jgi:hypothetical protein